MTLEIAEKKRKLTSDHGKDQYSKPATKASRGSPGRTGARIDRLAYRWEKKVKSDRSITLQLSLLLRKTGQINMHADRSLTSNRSRSNTHLESFADYLIVAGKNV